jgi:thioredoxin 1
MDAWTALSQEFVDRTAGRDRAEELDLGVPKGQGDYGRTIDFFGWTRLETEDITVERQRRFKVGHGNADMSNAGAIVSQWASESFSPVLENNEMGATNTLTVHVSDASFATEIEQADGLVLVDFWASWCGPCQIVAPVLDQLAGEYVGKAKVAKVDVDANQRTAMRFNVRSIPSILFFKNGQHVDTVIGAVPKATLEGKIKQHIS